MTTTTTTTTATATAAAAAAAATTTTTTTTTTRCTEIKSTPFSGVISCGRVWRKVPESDARSVAKSGGRCRNTMLGVWQAGSLNASSFASQNTQKVNNKNNINNNNNKTLYISTKHNLQMFGVVPFIKNASSYHWRELPQVSFSSRQKLRSILLSRQKTCFVVTNAYLSRQTRVCCDKSFVVTKMRHKAAPVSDSHSCFRFFSFASRRVTGPFSLPSNKSSNNILY